jgi:nucleoside-diphosphate-sugar epimerase
LPDLENGVDWEPLVADMDIVVHLATVTQSSHSDSADYVSASRGATANLVQACSRHMIKRLIFMSPIGAQTGFCGRRFGYRTLPCTNASQRSFRLRYSRSPARVF